MHTSRRLAVNAGLIVLILAALAAGYFLIAPGKTAAPTTTQLTASVKKGTVSTTISASGNVAPVREMAANFAVAGTVSDIKVKPGQKVKDGATLATLDEDDLRTAVTAAQTTLNNSENTLADAKAALADAEDAAAAAETTATDAKGSGGGSSSGGGTSVTSASSQVTNAQQQVDTAQSALDKARDQLDDATLTAPMAGVVVAVSGTVGSAVQASSSAQTSGSSDTSSAGGGTSAGSASGTSGSSSGSTSATGFITIADESTLVLSAAVPEADIDSVKAGQAVSMTFPALPGVTQTAKVTAISPTASTSSSVVTFTTTITLDDVPDKLRIGESADAVITTDSSKADALYVPSTAITTSGDTKTVKVMDADGKTSPVPVTTGVTGSNGTEIKTGLTLGQTVVIGSVSSATTTGTTGTTPGGAGARGGFGGGAGGAGGFGGGGGGRAFGGGAAGGR